MKLAINYDSLVGTAAPSLAGNSVGQIVSKVMTLIIPIAGMVMLLYLLYAGYIYMTSYGDPKAMQTAKQNITYAIIGFVVIAFAYIAGSIAGFTLDIQALKDLFPQ